MDAICPRSLLNCFSRTVVFPLNVFRQFSTDYAGSFVRRAVILTEPNSIPRKEMFCTRGHWVLSTRFLCLHNKS